MRITYENKAFIDEQYTHDSDFEGYTYDYEARCITTTLTAHLQKKRMHLKFNNVIYSELQSCLFWYGGNSLYDMWTEETF